MIQAVDLLKSYRYVNRHKALGLYPTYAIDAWLVTTISFLIIDSN